MFEMYRSLFSPDILDFQSDSQSILWCLNSAYRENDKVEIN